ncbi:CocE/NonD family hydrolase [Planktotalea sp.]|uniref:CocE/NonD family hydrolase n=1 Tax=Planktotalea sp. TaxID=2029877 RepID=UPI0025F42FCA|nr:CocE/NonD family hydrolase [Planktotalea sp.]
MQHAHLDSQTSNLNDAFMTSNTLRKITENPDLDISMPDGTRLSARTWMPDNAPDAPVPAILEFLPYRKRDGTTARDCLTHPYFARRGYACIRVDTRGNGDSEGLMDDEYSPQELADAVETIKWLAAQPWCSGTVGMMGISWGGFNALQVAALQPDALKAIITLCSTVDRYADDIHYKGGCLLNENLGWSGTMWSYSSRAPDPALRPDNWREIWLERLENEPFLAATWLDHQRRDAYWKHGSVCEDYSKIKAATLAIGGWGDAYKNAPPALIENLNAPVKAIIGPWVHKYPHFAIPEPRIGFLQESLRWWDRWLKGIETGVEDDPLYRPYLMESVPPKSWYTERAGSWLAIAEKPSDLPRETWHFGENSLQECPAAFRKTIQSPQTCGAHSGEYCAIWLGPELPDDQRSDDAMSLVFTSEPVTAKRDIVGAPQVTLTLSSGTAQGQIAVRLLDIQPNGASARITYGVLNLSHRHNHANPSAMTPDSPEEVTLDLDHIAYRLPKGHRLGVAVSTAYWPLIWPSPEASKLTLTEGSLSFPLRASGDTDEWTFETPEGDEPWQVETIREGSNSRKTVTDWATGVVTLEILDDFGKVKDSDHGLINGSIAREWWSIHPDDPLSAKGRTHWSDELEREGITLRTEATSEMTSDATHFHLTARLEAFENGDLIFEKDVQRSILRDNL